MANIPLQSISFPGLSDKYTTPVVDNTLTQTGAAADAKKTGDEIGAIKNDLSEKADKTDALSAYIVETETGSIASFSDGADDVPLKDLTVAIEPVQSGSGDPSPSNVRPISGWTGANVTACGVNIFNPDASTYETFDLTGQGAYRYGHAYPSGTYTIIYTGTKDYFFYRVPTKDLSDRGVTVNIAPNSTTTVTVDANHMLWVFTQSTDNPASDLMIALGTETVFKAFQGETYEVDWTTEAGTVYGGTLDVTTGVLTVNKVYEEFNLANYPYTTTNGFDAWSLTTTAVTSAGGNANGKICNITTYAYSSSALGVNHYYITVDTIVIFLEEGTARDKAVSFVYPLVTPQTYQLTPQEVKTVLGQNNIFADTGNVTVQYRADTKLYIDKVLNA